MDLCFGNKTITAIKHFPNKYTCISISVPYFGLYQREREREYETMILNQDTIKTFKFHSSHL